MMEPEGICNPAKLPAAHSQEPPAELQDTRAVKPLAELPAAKTYRHTKQTLKRQNTSLNLFMYPSFTVKPHNKRKLS